MGAPVGRGMWKAALADTPREAFNWRLAFSVICFGLMVSTFGREIIRNLTHSSPSQGAARGLDEGLIGTTVTQKSFIAGRPLLILHLRCVLNFTQNMAYP